MSAKDIERLARVLDPEAFAYDSVALDYLTEDRTQAIGHVRDILQALREPSEETIRIGDYQQEPDKENTKAIWQAMIDHLLAD